MKDKDIVLPLSYKKLIREVFNRFYISKESHKDGTFNVYQTKTLVWKYLLDKKNDLFNEDDWINVNKYLNVIVYSKIIKLFLKKNESFFDLKENDDEKEIIEQINKFVLNATKSKLKAKELMSCNVGLNIINSNNLMLKDKKELVIKQIEYIKNALSERII